MSDLTLALSEDTFAALFATVRDNFTQATSGDREFGAFSVSWNLGLRLEEGRVDLRSDNSVLISELDVVYDPVQLDLGVDIPEVCVGGFCIVPDPFGGCLVRAPRECLFAADPDLRIPLDITGLVESEISGAFRIRTAHFRHPNRTPAMTDLDAEDAGIPDLWQFFLDPIWLDLDVIDVADTVGNILDAAIENAVNGLLGGLPDWARDVIQMLLGSVVDLVRTLLDIGDDIDEWLSDLLGISIGLLDLVATLVADHFAKRTPIFEIEDPFPILGYLGPLIPVKIPLRNVAVQVTDDEMLLTADIGVV